MIKNKGNGYVERPNIMVIVLFFLAKDQNSLVSIDTCGFKQLMPIYDKPSNDLLSASTLMLAGIKDIPIIYLKIFL